jgi:hypothetical protein
MFCAAPIGFRLTLFAEPAQSEVDHDRAMPAFFGGVWRSNDVCRTHIFIENVAVGEDMRDSNGLVNYILP